MAGWKPRLVDPREPPPRSWWLVTPMELAARYDFSCDAMTDSIDPEDLADWQLALAFEAMEICHDHPPTDS